MRERPPGKPSHIPVISTAFFHPQSRESSQHQNPTPEDLTTENTLFYQLILAERHNYHQRVCRRLDALTRWLGYSYGILIIVAVIASLCVLIDHADTTDYKDWQEYLKCKSCIDVTAAAEVTTTLSTHMISTTDNYTGVLVQVTIPYNQVKEALSWSNSWERTPVVKYERPDGAWAILDLDPDDMKAYISESFYHYDPHPYVYTATVSYADGFWDQWHSLILRGYQEYTLFVHVKTGFGAFCALIGLFIVLFLLIDIIDFFRKRAYYEHREYCGKYEEYVELRRKSRKTQTEEEINDEDEDSAET